MYTLYGHQNSDVTRLAMLELNLSALDWRLCLSHDVVQTPALDVYGVHFQGYQEIASFAAAAGPRFDRLSPDKQKDYQNVVNERDQLKKSLGFDRPLRRAA